FGNDPISNNAIPASTVVPIGISPIIMLTNRTNPNGLGQTALFNDVTFQATALLLWTGTNCNGTAWGPFDAQHNFAVNPIAREPLSGTMNTFEYNVMVQNVLGIVQQGYFSQESILNPPFGVPNNFGAVTTNPLNGSCPGGNGYAFGP